MSIIKRVVLCMGLAVLLAPQASAELENPSAQEGVGVGHEATGQLCGRVDVVNDVATGNCPLHISSTGTIDIVTHTIFGESLRMRCLSEFEGAVNGSGEGRIGAAQISLPNPASGGVDCTGSGAARPCTEAEAVNLGADHQANWHFQMSEDHLAGGNIWMALRLCLANVDPFNSPIGGHFWLRVTGDGSGHPTALNSSDHRLRDPEVPLNQDAELTGAWSMEGDAAHGGVRVAH